MFSAQVSPSKALNIHPREFLKPNKRNHSLRYTAVRLRTPFVALPAGFTITNREDTNIEGDSQGSEKVLICTVDSSCTVQGYMWNSAAATR